MILLLASVLPQLTQLSPLVSAKPNNRAAVNPAALSNGMPASLVIGQSTFTTMNLATTATGLGFPRTATIDSSGNLWVADQNNNRILRYSPPFTTGMAANFVIGQALLTTSTVATSQNGLNGPCSVAFDLSGNLWVTDRYNNRILRYSPPFANGMMANLVIGQSTFTTNTAATSQTGLVSPWNIAFDSGNLWVDDDGNGRVLEYSQPFANGMGANLVIGQTSFTSSLPGLSSTGLNKPEGIAFDSLGNLWVGDQANNRVLRYSPPFTNSMPANIVIGQASFTTNAGVTSATGLSVPVGIGFDSSGNLWVAEATGNNRVVSYSPPFTNGMAANLVIGQGSFTTSVASTTQTGLRQPEGVAFDASGNLWVVDQGNNRVLSYQAGTAPQSSPCSSSQVAIDLSTGTNGGPNAQPVGTQEGASRWRLTSWSTSPPLPPYLLPIVNPPRSIDPANVGNGQFMPLPWATNPYVITQTPPAGSLLPNGGGPPGRINWITWNETGAMVNGVNYPVGSTGTLAADRQPQGTYTYQIPFNVNAAGGQLYVYAVAGADSVILSAVGSGAPPLSLPAGALPWGPSPSPSITTFTQGSYNLQADVANSLLAPNHYSAFAVYAVFCSNPAITPACDMAITKTMTPTSLQSNQPVTVTLTVTNVGGADCNGAVVDDPLAAGWTFLFNPGVTYQDSLWGCGPTVSCTTQPTYIFTPGVPQTLTFQFTVSAPGTYTNCATVTTTNDPYDPLNPGNNKSCATFTVTPLPSCDLAVTKTAAPSSVQVGQTVTFTITVTNTGAACGSGGIVVPTSVTDTVPSVFSNPSGSGSGWLCPPTSTLTVTCTTSSFFNLAQPQSSTITITATVAPAAPAGTYQNCADVANTASTPPTSSTTPCAQVIITPTTPPCANIDGTGLVSWWKADDPVNPPNTIATDSWGTNNGVFMNGATTGIPVKVGTGAFQFVPSANGYTLGGSYVQVPWSSPLEPPQVTVDAWINSTSAQHWTGTSTSGNIEFIVTSPGYDFSIGDSPAGPGRLRLVVYGGIATYGDAFGTTPLLDGHWHHVAGTYDGAYIKLYVDGVQDGTPLAYNGGLTYASGAPLEIGARTNSGPYGFFSGSIDDLETWNRPLMGSEIKAIHDADSAGKCPLIPVLSAVPSAGTVSGFSTVPVSSVSTPPPAGVAFPAGLIGFTVSGLTAGQTITVTITLGSPFPGSGFSYWKFNPNTNAWAQMPSAGNPSATLDSTRTIITLTLTDGVWPGDSDGSANGVIVDPGGPAISHLTTLTSTSKSTSTNCEGPACASSTTTTPPALTSSISTTTGPAPPKCIIATAAFGSELAAPVQFLRNFRDNEAQKTVLGATFLTAFNNWYYSWAPGIAQQIAPNENYKAATRLIIAPLIGGLFVGNAVFSVLAPLSTEMAIVSAGLLSSALIGLAYLTPAYALTWKMSKRKITKRTIYSLAIVAAALTFIATLTTGTFNIAADLTALAVVEVMLLTPALILRKMRQMLVGL